MNSIRLKRIGAKKQASYRIVVIDSSTGTSGASVERLGLYNPRMQPSLIRLDAARTLHWLREGAEPSDTVRSLLRKTGVWKQFHDGVTPEALEEPIVFLGPPVGQQKTSQRPAPSDEAPTPTPKAAAPTGEEDAAEEETAEAEAAEAAEAEAAETAEAEAIEAEAEAAAEEADVEEADEGAEEAVEPEATAEEAVETAEDEEAEASEEEDEEAEEKE